MSNIKHSAHCCLLAWTRALRKHHAGSPAPAPCRMREEGLAVGHVVPDPLKERTAEPRMGRWTPANSHLARPGCWQGYFLSPPAACLFNILSSLSPLLPGSLSHGSNPLHVGLDGFLHLNVCLLIPGNKFSTRRYLPKTFKGPVP